MKHLRLIVSLLVAFAFAAMPLTAWAPYGSGAASYPYLLPSGTESAPSYSFIDAPTTGMYYNGADIAFTVGGIDVLQVLADNRIVIGAGAAVGPALTNSGITGLFFPANSVGITILNTETARWTTSGYQQSFASANATGYALNTLKARGTVASPTVITTGDDLLTITGFGYVGATNTYQGAAQMLFDSTGTISDSATGISGQVKFLTAAVGTEPTEKFRITETGHTIHIGTSPTITAACGTSPTIAGKDEAFTITVGTGGVATTCTVTFANTFATNNPACVSNHQGAILLTRTVSTLTTVVVDAATPFTASGKIDVICRGWQ